MTRVVGIDPGTVSIDVCGIMDGQLYLDRTWPTAEALSEPAGLVELLTTSGPPDLIGGALDGEVAFLAGEITKSALFQGGVTSFLERAPALRSVALEAYIEGATKTARQLRCSAPSADEIRRGGSKSTDRPVEKREARGTVLDHLIFVSPASARRRLGVEASG